MNYTLINLSNLGNITLNNLHQDGEIEGETSVFWVDLAHKLCSQKRVPPRGSRGWLTFRHIYIVIIHVLST